MIRSPGHHNALFRQQGVLHPHVPAVVEVPQLLLPGELAHDLALGGGGDVLVGGEVVVHQHHPLPVEDLLAPAS